MSISSRFPIHGWVFCSLAGNNEPATASVRRLWFGNNFLMISWVQYLWRPKHCSFLRILVSFLLEYGISTASSGIWCTQSLLSWTVVRDRLSLHSFSSDWEQHVSHYCPLSTGWNRNGPETIRGNRYPWGARQDQGMVILAQQRFGPFQLEGSAEKLNYQVTLR